MRFYCRYQNENIYNIDTQFLWGENLLISPVLEQVHETLSSSILVYIYIIKITAAFLSYLKGS